MASSAFGIWDDVAEKIDQLEPARRLDQEKCAPQIAVRSFVVTFPMPDCEDSVQRYTS
jgi:hypothetical protein